MRRKFIDNTKFIVTIMGNRQLTITIPKIVGIITGWGKGQKLALNIFGERVYIEKHKEV